MSRSTSIFFFLILVSALTPASPAARTSISPPMTGPPPLIDGILDDGIWSTALSLKDFKTCMPDYGLDMSEDTEVLIAYDSENLYFAFRCSDSDPARIKTSVTRRDNMINDDWVSISLDSFDDQQTLYRFYVNPEGIQMDARATGNDEDFGIDLVWYSEGRIDDNGYTIETRIPLKSIRYSSDDPAAMGVIFERNISRSSERGTCPPLLPVRGPNLFTQTMRVLYAGIAPYNLFEVLPAVTNAHTWSRDGGIVLPEGRETDISLTAKAGLTSDLVVEGTYNPDFSQVEADAGQVDFNLRYSLFYEEKRPFFLEGKELFNIGGSVMSDCLRDIVHTRTIADPIAGAKLAGKLGEKNTVAMIYALDELSGVSGAEAHAHFTVLRYRRTLDRDGFIGAFGTSREQGPAFNRVAGGDGQLRISESGRIGFSGFTSLSGNDGQQDRTGHAVGANYEFNNRRWVLTGRVRDISTGFETETGYLTRTGITKIQSSLTRLFYPASSMILRADPLLVSRFIRDRETGRWEHYIAGYLGFTLSRSTRLRGGYGARSEIYTDREFDTSFLRIDLSSQILKSFFFHVDYRYGRKIRYTAAPYSGKGNDVLLSLGFQPVDRFSSNLEYRYSDFYRTSDGEMDFEYSITRVRNSYQLNKYSFFRFILEYNAFRKEMMTDFLVSFTYIPGTVVHLGYGSRYDRKVWRQDHYDDSARFHEARRSLFVKASYLYRF